MVPNSPRCMARSQHNIVKQLSSINKFKEKGEETSKLPPSAMRGYSRKTAIYKQGRGPHQT